MKITSNVHRTMDLTIIGMTLPFAIDLLRHIQNARDVNSSLAGSYREIEMALLEFIGNRPMPVPEPFRVSHRHSIVRWGDQVVSLKEITEK